MNFAAIDFETADYGADSACAVGVARVSGGRVARTLYRLIRPPRKDFIFTGIHGITWDDVRREQSFADLWPELSGILEGADFIAAHNAPFDRGVLHACLARAGLDGPPAPFVCTVRLARKLWEKPANLPAVCHKLGIPLKHHNALSDAEACAHIVMRAHEQGASL